MAENKNTADNQEFDDDGKPIEESKKDISEGGEDTPSENEQSIDEIEDDGTEPPVRNSVAQHIIARKNDTIKKLRSQSEDTGDTEDIDESDESTDSQTTVSEEISRQIKPIIDTVSSNADESELKELYSSEPEAEKYDKVIRRYMKSESWASVPPSAIYHHLAFGNAEIEGARKKRVADQEANQNTSAGRSIPNTDNTSGTDLPSVEQMDAMTDEEFEKLQLDVTVGKYLKK